MKLKKINIFEMKFRAMTTQQQYIYIKIVTLFILYTSSNRTNFFLSFYYYSFILWRVIIREEKINKYKYILHII